MVSSDEWVLKSDVPLVDEFTLKHPDGKKTVVDRAMLERIAKNNNKRVRDTGDETPIVIGHTRDGASESQQPEIVGYARSFTVKPLFKTGRYAIHAVCRFMKSKLDKIKNFPRRSVELWVGREEIDPISLLGATSPQRDLGLLKFDRKHNTITRAIPMAARKAKLERPEESGDQVQKIVEEVVKSMVSSGVLKEAIHDCLNELENGEGEEQGQDGQPPEMDGNAPPMDGEEGPPEGEMAPPQGAASGQAQDIPPKPAKMGTGGAPAFATPSGSNTYVPGMAEEKKRMERDGERSKLSKMETRLQAIERENNELKLHLRRAARERDLIQLENEGIELDRVEELDDAQRLSDDVWEARKERIRARYSRSPLGGPVLALQREHTPTRNHRIKNDGPTTLDEVKRQAAEAARTGKRYDEVAIEANAENVL